MVFDDPVSRPPVSLLVPILALAAAFLLLWTRPASGAAGRASLREPASGTPWLWPVRGRVVRRFFVVGNRFARGQHRGVSIAAAPGVAVRAPCGGQVLFAGRVPDSGPTVTVGCGRLNATLTRLGAVRVRRGAWLAPGEGVGSAGAAAAVQLGARVRAIRDGYLDPLTLLRADPPPPLPPLGPAPRSRPRSEPPRLSPAPRVAPEPAPAVPIERWWLPAGLGLLGAGATFGLGRGVRRRLRAEGRWRTHVVAGGRG